jgi:two-component system, NarL family, response regulator
VLVLSTYGDAENLRGMLQAGARGYLVHDTDPQAILEGIRAVASGRTWVAHKVMQGLMEYTASEQAETENEELSPREREVLQLLGKGYSNSRIADEMDVKERTVRFHLENLMSKLGVNSRVEVVLAAIQRGWIES